MGPMDYDLFDDLDEVIQLIEPHEPRTAAVLSAQYARFVASSGSPADLADLCDCLLTLSGIIRRYHVVDRGVTTDQLATGLRDLVDNLEKTFGSLNGGTVCRHVISPRRSLWNLGLQPHVAS